MAWRVARSLDTLLAELNERGPNRSKASDGSIGDAAHASRSSDHNPWRQVAGVGVVGARDFTDDPPSLDCDWLAEHLEAMLRAGEHPALRSGAYVIWDRRIISRDRVAEGWRPYSGSNPHTKHLHLSVTTDPGGFDSTAPWLTEEEDMTPEAMDKLADLVAEKVWAKRLDGADGRESQTAHWMLAQVRNLVEGLRGK